MIGKQERNKRIKIQRERSVGVIGNMILIGIEIERKQESQISVYKCVSIYHY